jgi:hypothetical protein
MAIFLSILSSLLVGLILTVIPWTDVWDSNYLIQPHPFLRTLLLSAFTRGAVSGLGLVNLVLALHEAGQHLGGEPDEP